MYIYDFTYCLSYLVADACFMPIDIYDTKFKVATNVRSHTYIFESNELVE